LDFFGYRICGNANLGRWHVQARADSDKFLNRSETRRAAKTFYFQGFAPRLVFMRVANPKISQF